MCSREGEQGVGCERAVVCVDIETYVEKVREREVREREGREGEKELREGEEGGGG